MRPQDAVTAAAAAFGSTSQHLLDRAMRKGEESLQLELRRRTTELAASHSQFEEETSSLIRSSPFPYARTRLAAEPESWVKRIGLRY